MNNTLRFYQQNTNSLIEQYDSVEFEAVHKDWLDCVPLQGTVLDIGAGSGRDARYLAKNGLTVFAVEPVFELISAAKDNSTDLDITWVEDSLPNLDTSKQLNTHFDLILLSAVWMHLSPTERKLSMQNMSSLLNHSGRLVITLRYGEFADGRVAYPVSAAEVTELAHGHGLKVLRETDVRRDQLGRGDVIWQTLVLGK
ncbi:class I SAM-dependent methyltransferase [Thalassotalea ponticola]|uniref:class I SAM-dependent methyltransferase n=1 Tax=Thalassotalea ponticola TaxID=1523392 RepID=UPI0025B2BC3A|nr:class I SAM-dependent methyltransferase [Thalassotalea ponticola]MDN3652347.1 class I SAM-dependent methyltransferase [Thalassotalea ponticola]